MTDESNDIIAACDIHQPEPDYSQIEMVAIAGVIAVFRMKTTS